MKSEYKLIGLSRPSSATLQYPGKDESFNAKYNFDESLWKFVENNWDNVNLKAIVAHSGFCDDGETPLNPIVIKVEPI